MISHTLSIRPRGSGQVIVGQYTLSSAAMTSMIIVKASDVAPKTLLRTLWSEESQNAGTYSIYWDGLDDNGNDIIATNDYEAILLRNNIAVEHFKVGNTSADLSGSTVIRGYTSIVGTVPHNGYLYCTTGFEEMAPSAIKLQISDIQKKHNIAWTTTNPLTGLYVCTDGINVYWAGNDPYPQYEPGSPTGMSGVYGTKISDDTFYTFGGGGTSVLVGGYITYPNVIDLVLNDPTNLPTGLATDGTYIFVARGSQNKIYAYKISDGTLSHTNSDYTNPRNLAYDSSNGGRLWLIHDTNTVLNPVITAGTGDVPIASCSLTIFFGTAPKLGLAVYNNGGTNILGVIYGGTAQIMRGFDISSASPTGSYLGQYGQSGGYQSVRTVSVDRFQFSDTTVGVYNPSISFDQSNGDMYLGDTGNWRVLRYSTTWGATPTFTHIETVSYIPVGYSCAVDKTDPTRMFAYFNEFEYDYTNNTWTHVRNWSGNANYDHYAGSAVFQNIFTLNSITYATITYYDPGNRNLRSPEFCQLDNTSGILYQGAGGRLGVFANIVIETDGTIRRFVPDGNFAAGTGGYWSEETVSGIDGSNWLTYNAATNVCDIYPLIASTDAIFENHHGIPAKSLNNVFAVFNNLGPLSTQPDCTYNLELYDPIKGKFASTAQTTIRDTYGYNGEFPIGSRYDVGNAVINAGINIQSINNLFVWGYRGENWKSGQTNRFIITTDKGVVAYSFGIEGYYAPMTNGSTEAPAEFAGNPLEWDIFQYDTDTYCLVHCDESINSCLHVWKITGMSSIIQQTIQLLPPPTVDPTPGTDLIGNKTLNTAMSSGSGWTLPGSPSAGFLSRVGLKSCDPYYPDISFYAPAGENNTITRSLSPTSDLAIWTISGLISFEDNPNASGIGSKMEVLDAGGLIICDFYYKVNFATDPDTYSVGTNGTDIISYSSVNNTSLVRNTMGKLKQFILSATSNYNLSITYDGSTELVNRVNPLADWETPTTLRFKTIDIGTSQGAASIYVQKLWYNDALTGGVAPYVVSMETIDTTHIKAVMSKKVTGTISGWSFNNGSSLSITSVSGSGTDELTFLVGTMAQGETITGSYNSSTGNIIDTTNENLPLASFTNQSVTNNISLVATLVQIKQANGDNATFTTNPTSGNLIVAGMMGSFDSGSYGCTDTQGNTYTLINQQVIGAGADSSMRWFYAYNITGGANTVTLSGPNAFKQVVIAEYSGIYSSGDPLLDSDGNKGNPDPINSVITFADDALTIAILFNVYGSTYAGITASGMSIAYNNGSVDYAHDLHTAYTLSPLTAGFDVTTPDIMNTMICAAFKLG